MLILDTIFQAVKSDFCDLIDRRLRGNTLEIITSIPTLTSSYVSVFISFREGKYIVSDGGWVSKNMYESPIVEDSDMLNRIFLQYKNHFKIKETLSPDNSIFYYKTTTKLELVSALVFDVGNYVSSVVNSQNVVFKEVEDQDKKLFHNRVNGYIRERFGQSKIDLNTAVQINDTQRIRFNAVIHANARDHYYVMYVTGSRPSFFIKDITEATVNFEIINELAIRRDYFKKLAIINTSAPGYDKEKSSIYLSKLANALQREPILLNTQNDDFKLAEALPVG